MTSLLLFISGLILHCNFFVSDPVYCVKLYALLGIVNYPRYPSYTPTVNDNLKGRLAENETRLNVQESEYLVRETQTEAPSIQQLRVVKDLEYVAFIFQRTMPPLNPKGINVVQVETS